ncbi:molybdopterin-binding protein [Clostridium sp.]|uniref:molybdopterin-binding protein n=1 Tax=Clostridium sp. TaxID=1506 RepID=UPI002FC95CB1
MEQVKVEDAIGMIIGHDLTKIVPGEFKGVAFKKGHIITPKDIEDLKKIGKNHIYVVNLSNGFLHEDQCALRIGQAITGSGTFFEDPSEGKVNIKAEKRGILKINLDALDKINDIDNIILSTLHNNSIVDENTIVAGTKIIPLALEEKYIEEVENICKNCNNVISIMPLKHQKVGIVITGTEVYEGKIKDKFAPVIEDKLNSYDCSIMGKTFVPDNLNNITSAIKDFINDGAEVIITSGGMSVDPDDVTPNAIRECSEEVISYGSPVLPGAMFMLAYSKSATIIGLPACGMFNKTTVFDLVLPRVMAKDRISKREINRLAHGGLCLKCEVCKYPVCPFGK